ncbi:uncharacterized protein A1O9_00887 [Exophiala aquamarina CBS 119918]|uniref:Uncharacterized protein n=1 Tax=Exophiala aquamarina CBS 119918 TaxID=1182545 RepID=A0A072PU87_9EURO|nr:uncharacterized protein A1O9_00887 [Exophiala aquamarina CBS 119918]KEF62913.1 hypothetical protein A1O9_00887 [Exophiala aquamarina CBS 119918]
MSSTIIKTLSVMRMAAGLSTLIVPRQVGPLFGLAMSPESSLLARLFGSRDFVVGAYLWKTAREWDTSQVQQLQGEEGVREGLLSRTDSSSHGSGTAAKSDGVPGFAQDQGNYISTATVRHNNVTTALWLGVACDAVDILSATVCLIERNISDLAFLELGSAALVLTAAGLWQLKVMQNKKTQGEL